MMRSVFSVSIVALCALGAAYAAQAERAIMIRDAYIYADKAPGRPLDPKVREFLHFVLSREGQEIIQKNGPYTAIPASYVREQLKKLD